MTEAAVVPLQARALDLIARHRHLASQMDETVKPDADRDLLDSLAGLFREPLLSAEPPEVDKVGLGYRAVFPDAGVEMGLNRIRESRGEISGQLTVQLKRGKLSFTDGHLFGARFNLSSLTARTTAAKYLNERIKGDWAGMLERFCLQVIAGENQGQPFSMVGRRQRQAAGRYLMPPVLPLGAATIAFGAGGTGKSTFAAGVAAATACGRAFITGWEPTPGQVLVLDWEDCAETWNDRLAAIAAGIGAPAPDIHYRAMTRPLADDLEAIAAYVSEKMILLVIVDSLGLATGSSREGSEASDGAFRLFEALRELGATSLLIDHVAGADLENPRPTAKPYGSIYKLNLARSAFELRREKDADGDRTELLLVHNKANTQAKLPPLGIAIVRDETSIRFERTDVEAPDLVTALSYPERMARILRGGPQTRATIAEELGTTESNVRSILTRDKGRRFARLNDGRVGLGLGQAG